MKGEGKERAGVLQINMEPDLVTVESFENGILLRGPCSPSQADVTEGVADQLPVRGPRETWWRRVGGRSGATGGCLCLRLGRGLPLGAKQQPGVILAFQVAGRGNEPGQVLV